LRRQAVQVEPVFNAIFHDLIVRNKIKVSTQCVFSLPKCPNVGLRRNVSRLEPGLLDLLDTI
jgi:hypothetical protein